MSLLKECGGKIRAVALTAIRSEYDLLYPVLVAMRRDKRFSPSVIAAGAHLSPLHDRSVRLIEADGFPIKAKLTTLRAGARGDTVGGRVEAAARLLGALPRALEREKPDLLMVLGDREEALIGALAALYLGIPTVHFAGGDDTSPEGGDVDEEARHATTKLSHVHLTMAEAHTKRILGLGEEKWRVKTVGNPGLDRLEPKGRRPFGDHILVIHHAVSSASREAAAEMDRILSECLATGLDVYVGAPNSDPGHAAILKVIENHKRHPKLHAYRNLPRAEFIGLLRGARAIVGNSSLGLLEAPFLGLPCVNVGQRQRGRLAGDNVLFVDADKIRPALRRALFDDRFRAAVRRGTSPYGDGHSAERSLGFLASLPGKRKLLAKRITY